MEGSTAEKPPWGNVEGSEAGKCFIAEPEVCMIFPGITVTARKAAIANATGKVCSTQVIY